MSALGLCPIATKPVAGISFSSPVILFFVNTDITCPSPFTSTVDVLNNISIFFVFFIFFPA